MVGFPVYTDLPLYPPPSAQWLVRWNQLMADPWLRKKLDRKNRLIEHIDYLKMNVPELVQMPAGIVLDIGPGAGELLELVRCIGHAGRGVDAARGEGGMGNNYLDACRLMHLRQHVNVDYTGLHTFIYKQRADEWGRYCLINSRGSLEQALSDFMVGPPHHEHQDSQRLSWSIDAALEEVIEALFNYVDRLLRDDGIFMIHANGAKNDKVFDEMFVALGSKRFQLVKHKDHRLYKWTK